MTHNNNLGALQHPIGTGFGPHTTGMEVINGIDLSGKMVIVTGGNTGIGLETVKTLSASGATVLVAARDTSKARINLDGLPNVQIAPMDIMNPDSIDTFAEAFLAKGSPLHLLINNAGIMWVPLRKDKRGIESQFATNYVGQFHLTARLWPALKQAGAARVVNVSSLGHHMSDIDFTDINFDHRPYETLQAYGQSKTACNLFSLELDKRGCRHGIRSYAVHPGSIAGTELGREASMALWQQMGFLDADGQMYPEVRAGLKTIAQGAATTIWAATSPQLSDTGGVYCEDCDIAALLNSPAQQHKNGVQSYSLDEHHAHRLWTYTEQLTGISFAAD